MLSQVEGIGGEGEAVEVLNIIQSGGQEVQPFVDAVLDTCRGWVLGQHYGGLAYFSEDANFVTYLSRNDRLIYFSSIKHVFVYLISLAIYPFYCNYTFISDTVQTAMMFINEFNDQAVVLYISYKYHTDTWILPRLQISLSDF